MSRRAREASGRTARTRRARVAAEALEPRSLMCIDHALTVEHDGLPEPVLPGGNNHDVSWYAPVARSGAIDAVGAAAGDANPTWTTNAAGLPLLTSRADGRGLKIFLDFDGYNSDLPFSTDGDTNTFNASEQRNVYDTWRDVVSYFSMLDVNVTTIQPPTGGSNPVFVWHRISNSIQGGAAYVGWITNDSSNSWTGRDGGTTRRSGVAHEVGHQFGLSHQAEYDRNANETTDYSDGWNNRNRPIIGVDFAQNVRGWFYGRNGDNPANLVDDLAVMANAVKGRVGGDGYMPDDHGGLTSSATVLAGAGATSSGVIERVGDADVFRFTSVGGTYHIDATPTFESAASPKIELLHSTGTIIAARDDADQRNWNMNDQEFDVELPAGGTYYVRVSGGGDYSEQGEYLVTAAPLAAGAAAGWGSADVGNTTIYRGGTAAFDPSTGVLTQIAGGTDIWSTSDQFRFTYTTLTGDGSITARVDSLQDTGFHAKAGVMIRQSLAANSAHAFMGLKPSGVLDPIARPTTGGDSLTAGTSQASTHRWVRITRVGSTFTLATSADGASWSTVGTRTISMAGPVYIGLATTAWNARAQTYSKFSNISLTGALTDETTAPNGLTPPTIATITPAGGASTGINLSWSASAGASGYVVARSVDGVNYADVATLGAATLSYPDHGLFGSMRYFYRVSALSGTTRSAPSAAASAVNKPNAPAIPHSSYAQPFITPSTSRIYLNWTDTQGDAGYRVERSDNGGGTYTQIATTPTNASGYNDSGLAANTTYTYRITPVTSVGDGAAPSLVITATTRMDAPANFRFTAVNATSVALAWNDAIGETAYRLERSTDRTTWTTVATPGEDVTAASIGGLTPLSKYYYRLVALNGTIESVPSVIFAATAPAAPLPSPWSYADVGAVGGRGASGLSGDTWTLIGNGPDIWSTTDQFHYASRPVIGNGHITARVGAFDGTNGWSKAGVMFRESTATGSRFAMVTFNQNGNVQFNFRTGTSASAAQFASVPDKTVPVWLRLVRTGNNFTGSWSQDGVTWNVIGTQAIGMSTSATMGMAVNSYNSTTLTKATFTNLAAVVTPLVPTGLTASAGDARVTLGWSASAEATSYRVKRATTAGGPYATLGIVTTPGYVDDAVANDTRYYYVVSAVNGGLESADSAEAAATPQPPAPPVPWLAPGSAATWDASTKALTVTGAATIIADPGADAPIITASGAAAVVSVNTPEGGPVNLGGLQLSNNASANVSATGATRTVFVNGANFTIDTTATLDLGDNVMILRNGGSGPAAQTVARRVTGYLKTGLENGGSYDWLGTGVSSAEAAADNAAAGSVLYGLGVLQNNLAAPGTPDGTTTDQTAGNEIYTSFAGQAVSLNDVLVRYTYMGDGDLDGEITGTDYALIDNGLAFDLAGWLNGDFDYSGELDGTDYALIDNAFAFQTGTLSFFSTAEEPDDGKDGERVVDAVVA